MGPRGSLMVLLSTIVLTVSSLPTDVEKRSLSLFSVVQFPNGQCTSTTDSSIFGTCFSSTECSDKGGAAQGNCAAGFGVCCVFVKTGCSDVEKIDQNCTYIQNENYPNAETTADRACNYMVSGSSDICQIRLDFNRLELGIINPGGACTRGSIMTGSTTGRQYTFCGTNDGEHLYYETGSSTSDSRFVLNTGTGADNRFWKIKVSMIECSSMEKAPRDCAQYFTGEGGVFSSPGFASGTLPQSQTFTTCFRQEAGFCSINYSRDTGTAMPNTFLLGNIAIAAETANCAIARLLIPASNLPADYVCGGRFSAVQGNVENGIITQSRAPFQVTLESAADVMGSTGYKLMWSQVPC